jgi:ribosomal protein S18 acetylase RimI-like enzyme
LLSNIDDTYESTVGYTLKSLFIDSQNQSQSFSIIIVIVLVTKYMTKDKKLYGFKKPIKIIIRNVHRNDVPQIVKLQKETFPDLAIYDMIWPPSLLESHIRVFPEGQFCVELEGTIIASASSLIVSLKPEYATHTWHEVTGYGMFTNHDPTGDSLYGADISTHPEFRRQGIATMLYDARKKLAIKLNLRRIIAGGRLFNYYKYANKMSPDEYAQKVVRGELKDPVLSFQLKNGFRFIKILPDYLDDIRSLNNASFIEWLNPKFFSLPVFAHDY